MDEPVWDKLWPIVPTLPADAQGTHHTAAEPASVGGGHCHFGQMLPIVANLKPKVRVEEDKGTARPYAHPALCRPHRQGHSATIQLQRQGGRSREKPLGQGQRGQDKAADIDGDVSAELGAGSAVGFPQGL